MRKAFTMVELIFVIVIVGILASVAVPRFAATRNDAVITSAIATIASVKSSLATQRQLMILRGNFDSITSINADKKGAITVFGNKNGIIKDTKNVAIQVLDSTIPLCQDREKGCWSLASGTNYSYKMPDGKTVAFQLTNGRFECKVPTSAECKTLTQ